MSLGLILASGELVVLTSPTLPVKTGTLSMT